MIENKYEERQVTQRVLTDRTYVCDVCGRKMKIPQHYWHISVQNDNCDPYEEYDCCSEYCVDEIYSKYFKQCQETTDNNNWIEFCHKYTRSVDEILNKSDKGELNNNEI